MPIEVTVKPEDVDAMVRDALMQSTIGKLIESTITSALKTGTYNNPVDNAVRDFVQRETAKILADLYRPKLCAAIQEALAAKLSDDWLKSQADRFADRLVRDINDR